MRLISKVAAVKREREKDRDRLATGSGKYRVSSPDDKLTQRPIIGQRRLSAPLVFSGFLWFSCLNAVPKETSDGLMRSLLTVCEIVIRSRVPSSGFLRKLLLWFFQLLRFDLLFINANSTNYFCLLVSEILIVCLTGNILLRKDLWRFVAFVPDIIGLFGLLGVIGGHSTLLLGHFYSFWRGRVAVPGLFE